MGGGGRAGTEAVEPAPSDEEISRQLPSAAHANRRLGPDLARALAADVDQLSEDPFDRSASEIVAAVAAGRRLEGWALWCQLSVAAALLRRWQSEPPAEDPDGPNASQRTARRHQGAGHSPADDAIAARAEAEMSSALRRARCRVPRATDLVDDFVAAELSLACGLSTGAARDRVWAAQILLIDGKLPRTALLLKAGLLDWPKVQVLTRRLGLGTERLLAAAVEAVLIPDEELTAELPAVTRMTVPAIAAAIEAAIMALDAEAAAARARQARVERRVSTWNDPDGMARLEAKTGAEHVAAMWNALTAAARRVKRTGDSRSIDQIRLDELVLRVTGHLSDGPGAADPAPSRTATGATGATGSTPGVLDRSTAAAEERSGAGVRSGASADDGRWDRDPHDQQTASNSSCHCSPPPLTGLAVSLTMPLATYLALADDPAVLDSYGPIPAALARQIARDAARDQPLTTTWRCVVTDDEHGTVIGLGRPVSTPKHDPPSRLADLVRTQHPLCAFPGCRIPARRCDLDHRVPYDHSGGGRGGPTCSCNLQPLCRTHHRLKTTGLLTVRTSSERLPSDALVWTTRAGLRYASTLDPATPPPVPPGFQPLLDRLKADRAADRASLRWMNTAMRTAYRRGKRDERSQTQADLEKALAAEVRHHDYGEVLARADDDPAAVPPRPEPADRIPDVPSWMDHLPVVPWETDEPEDG